MAIRAVRKESGQLDTELDILLVSPVLYASNYIHLNALKGEGLLKIKPIKNKRTLHVYENTL